MNIMVQDLTVVVFVDYVPVNNFSIMSGHVKLSSRVEPEASSIIRVLAERSLIGTYLYS